MSAHNSLHQHFEVGGALAGDATGASNGVAFDTRGIEEVMVVLSVGDIASSGTLDVKVQEASASSTGPYTDITGASFAQVVAAGANQTYVGRILTNVGTRSRWMRLVGTVGTEALSYGACFLAGAQHDKPVTQENTLAFDINPEIAD